MSDKTEIPKELQDVCREIGRIAREHGLTQLTGKFSPGYKSVWRDDIHFDWSAGRHGAESNKLRIHSQVWITAEIDEPNGNKDGTL